MKKRKLGVLLSALIFGCALTGCGKPMHAITDEEQDLIVTYAAEAIAKYNVYQKDGIQAVNAKLIKEVEEEQKEEKEDNKTDETGGSSNSSGESGSIDNVSTAGVSLEDALNLEDVSFHFAGIEASTSYTDVASTTADAGKMLVIVSFELSAKAATTLNVYDMEPVFKLNLGGKQYKHNMTVLPSDLTTFKDDLKAKETRNVIVIFQTSKDAASDLSDFTLSVSVNGKNSTIKCEN